MKKIILIALVLALDMVSLSLAAEDKWTYKADMPTARGFVSGTVVDGKIYVIGGFPTHNSVTSAVEMYDPTADKWTRMANMPSGRCAHATCTFNGKIYVFGGTSPNPYSTAKKNVYVYDPQTDIWTQKNNMPSANALCGIAVVDDTIYMIGGSLSASSRPVSTVMAYDPSADSWTQKASMPTARGFLSACVVDGKIYAIGGAPQNYQSVCYKNVEVYDPATNTWTRKSDKPTRQAAMATCVVAGRIYAIGGFSPSGISTANEMYDPVTDTWHIKSPLQQKRLMPFVGSVGDKVYVIGGSYPDSQGQPIILSTAEEYDTGFNVPSPDFNGDGTVDSADMCIMIDHWGEDYTLCDIAPPPWGDGIVDVYDLIVLAEHLFDDYRAIAQWKLDEKVGDIAYDSIGGHDATLHGEPLWQPANGRFAGALEFDGLDDYIITPFILNPANGSLSAFAWIQVGIPGQVIISQADTFAGRTVTPGSTWLGVEASSGTLMTEFSAMYFGALVSETVVTDSQWHHVGFVYDLGSMHRLLYVDGVQVAEDATVVSGMPLDSGLNIGVGKNLEAGTFFSGLIDDIRIYDVALTSEQIEAFHE